MNINGVHHIAIDTTDFRKSISFYTDTLKMQFVDEVDLGGDYVAYIKSSDGVLLELFRHKPDTFPIVQSSNEIGVKHLAFSVDNIESWNEYLKNLNIKFTLELLYIQQINKRVLLIEGPDHVIIELCQEMA